MITSNTPWSPKGDKLLDAQGNVVATFTNINDLELVLALIRDRNKINDQLANLRDCAEALDDLIN